MMATANDPTSGPTFNDLPGEIIQAILFYLPPQTLAALQSTSKRLKPLVDEPLLWRHHCRVNYTYWAPDHAVAEKFAGPATDVDWQSLFKQRWRRDREIASTLNGIIGTQQKRIDKLVDIAESAYDAKDELLRQASVGSDVDDHLARCWWSEASLGLIQRRMAIEVWERMSKGEDVPLEHALGAFDMFTLGTRKGDLQDISEKLDSMAARYREQHTHHEEYSPRQRALTLVQFLRDSGFTGVEDEARDYHCMENNFIGFALHDRKHQTLPLILTSIYICLAQRVGVDARASNVPLHIYGVVFAPSGKTLDGKTAQPGSAIEYMFIDPFRHANEVEVSDVQRHLTAIGISSSSYDEYTTVASTRDLVIRTTRNIMTSAQTMRERELMERADEEDAEDGWNINAPQIDEAYYAALWAMLLVQTASALDVGDPLQTVQQAARRARIMPWLLEKIQPQYPWDVKLLEDFVLQMFIHTARPVLNSVFVGHGMGARHGTGDHYQLLEITRAIRTEDSVRKPVQARPTAMPMITEGQRQAQIPGSWGRWEEGTEKVKYRIGDVFRHRRYGYEGVIVGWDLKCEKDEGWIAQMGVRRLSGGAEQSFYHVL